MQNSPQGYGGVYIGLQHDEVKYPGQNKPLRLCVRGHFRGSNTPYSEPQKVGTWV